MKTITRYRCEECGMIHDEEWDAEDCCQPEVKEVVFYVCDKCKKEYEARKEAFECCNQTKLTK